MAMIHEQMLVDEYINSVLELDEQQFDEYFDSLSLEQQEELTEIIGKIAKGIGKIAVAPITLPYKVGKAAVKGVAKVATSNPVNLFSKSKCASCISVIVPFKPVIP